MTTEQKTVPLWQAAKHMQEDEVVYESAVYLIRVFDGIYQFYSNKEGWKEISCTLRSDIDYYTGQPKVQQEPVEVDWDTAYTDMRDNNSEYLREGSEYIYHLKEDHLYVRHNNTNWSESSRECFNELKKVKWRKVENTGEMKKVAQSSQAVVQALESAISYCYELHSKTAETDPSFEYIVGDYEEILRKADELNQTQTIKLTPWLGGDMPVDRECLVLCHYRDGTSTIGFANTFTWFHRDTVFGNGFSLDIIAYAVIQIEGA